MENNVISRAEHEEFRKRIEAEIIEKNVQQIQELVTSVEKMAISLQSMVKEQEQQGQRLEALENRDGEMWRKVTGHIVTVIIGIVIGYIFKQIGM